MDAEVALKFFVVFLIFGMPMLIGGFAIWSSLQKTKYRAQLSQVSDKEREELARLNQVADRLNERIETLEAILDAEVPDWREEHELQG